MHGLNQIHSLNAQAAIDEHNRSCKEALAAGHSYLAHNDALGKPDTNQKIVVFPTAASLKHHILTTVKPTDLDTVTLVYGSN